jgi:hypothetical protein
VGVLEPVCQSVSGTMVCDCDLPADGRCKVYDRYRISTGTKYQ